MDGWTGWIQLAMVIAHVFKLTVGVLHRISLILVVLFKCSCEAL